jgi:RNA polymerase sigma-70 factor (ECF subfamily)
LEEAELIARILNNDKKAFDLLVKTYRQQIINTCYKFLLEKADAEDVSQEVFVEIYYSLKNYRGDSKLSTWIYRIAVTRSLDEIKKRNRKKRITALGKMLHLDEIAQWIGGGSRPDKLMEAKDQWNEISAALNALPENQRVAFTLSKIDGYSNTEIAEIMNTTNSAVESLIHRAKKKVNEELSKILKKY